MFKFHVSLGVRSSWKIRWNSESNVFFAYGWDRPDQAQRFWAWPVSLCVTNVSAIATHQAFKHPPLLPRGGILADDMGLGKTITTIALPRSCRPSKGLWIWHRVDRIIKGNQFMLMSSTVSTFFGFVKFLCVWEMCMCIGTIRYTSISSEIQILTLGISLSMFFLGG